ncbi:Glycosyltransferase [Methanosarcina sp. MTP4]|uniref:glycosyltransferase family 4 protein n=1 Tax=Methanosarcina sp. MTP4 TaxID=1434100 RepID=UPI0006154360|nr:glycosyltransferase family 4 protein [Methanosarcina sp. MTP4]AKB25965.1 Glycosyltransferase [Methanosarcina sp. MTP4]
MVNLKLTSNKDLIYYYPMGSGAPSDISRKIFKYLLVHREDLPFENIKIFCKKKNVTKIKEELKDVNIITYSDLGKISHNSLIHIPVLPSILPNSKFLLYIYCTHIKKTKVVLQYHGDVRGELKISYKDVVSLAHILTYLFVPNILKSADAVLVHSNYMNDIIHNYGVNKSFVISNAIETDWLKPLEKEICIEQSINKKSYNIFYHGRLSWEKGVDLLIDAVFFCLKNNYSNIILYLAGDGPSRRYLEKLCCRLGIENNVVFLGNLDKKTIKWFLKDVDVAIYPSRFDAFSLAILEALSCSNCNVYFSKKAGIYNFVIKDGFKLHAFEPSVENIIKIIEQKEFVDKSELQKEFAKKYTFDSVVFDYIKLYTNVIDDINSN